MGVFSVLLIAVGAVLTFAIERGPTASTSTPLASS